MGGRTAVVIGNVKGYKDVSSRELAGKRYC